MDDNTNGGSAETPSREPGPTPDGDDNGTDGPERVDRGDHRPGGPWRERVRLGPGGLAYTPGQVIVPAEHEDRATRLLELYASGPDIRQERNRDIDREESRDGEHIRFSGLPQVLRAVQLLRQAGIEAQPNHVLFATGCCPPHPASRGRDGAYRRTYRDAGTKAEPFYGDPFYGDPFYGDPFYGDAGGGGCCCCGRGTMAAPFYGDPFYGDPFYGDPFYGDPFYGDAPGNPAVAGTHPSGRRPSSARPADPQAAPAADATDFDRVRIAILDTGWARQKAPAKPATLHDHGGDVPDEDGDRFLDPAAGHGTFIAGVIEQLAPGCSLELFAPLSGYGDGDEWTIAHILDELAQRPEDGGKPHELLPHLVNLSFGGYSPYGMAVLARPIAKLQDRGVVIVSSAGNDATCVPTVPAVMPGVIGVAALDENGDPAPFTNYGPWVRACTFGQDVVSWFFDGFDGPEQPVDGGRDPDSFEGWARWSGTSFAAPRLVARLAAEIAGGASGHEAVARLIDDPDLERKPLLGTHVP